MDFSCELPSGFLAEHVLAAVRGSLSPALINHSVRSFLFAELLAAHEGCLQDAAYDRDLLFAATVLHDIGTGPLAKGEARFEVEGAHLAAKLLRGLGVDEAGVDRVWEAIALHASAGIAERRGLLTYLTRGGIGLDFGQNAAVVLGHEERIHTEYPRLGMVSAVVDAIVGHAARSEAASAPYSIGGTLLRERRSTGTTAMELAATSSPWHD